MKLYVHKLNRLGELNQVKLRWVPAHVGIPGNERADELAKLGSCIPFANLEPSVGILWCLIKSCTNNWMRTEQRKFWSSQVDLRHAQKFVRNIDDNRSKMILSLKRKEIRLVVGFLTGHYPVKRNYFIPLDFGPTRLTLAVLT